MKSSRNPCSKFDKKSVKTEGARDTDCTDFDAIRAHRDMHTRMDINDFIVRPIPCIDLHGLDRLQLQLHKYIIIV